MHKGEETLCWYCNKYLGNCPWSDSFTPVEGWIAVPTKILTQNGFINSFRVNECPMFEYQGKCSNCIHAKGYSVDILGAKYCMICKESDSCEIDKCTKYINKNLKRIKDEK